MERKEEEKVIKGAVEEELRKIKEELRRERRQGMLEMVRLREEMREMTEELRGLVRGEGSKLEKKLEEVGNMLVEWKMEGSRKEKKEKGEGTRNKRTKEVSCQTGEGEEEEESTWKRQPRALTKEEWEEEKEKRKERKRNVRVIGVKPEDNEMACVVGNIAAWTRKVARVEQAVKEEGSMLLRFKSMEAKMEVWAERGKLKGSGIWLEEDTTEREEEIREWLYREKRRLQERGLEVRVTYMRAEVGDTLWSWNEVRGKMEIIGTRGRVEEGEECGEQGEKRSEGGGL